jgi:hypothetical protein
MIFPIAKFRLLYPDFVDYSDELVLAISEQALCYFSHGCGDDCVSQLWMLSVAHMLYMRQSADDGNTTSGAVTSATIDKVSVSFAAPSSTSAQSHWFNMSPYGQQFLVHNRRCNGGVKFIGGSLERSAFRKVHGRFR